MDGINSCTRWGIADRPAKAGDTGEFFCFPPFLILTKLLVSRRERVSNNRK